MELMGVIHLGVLLVLGKISCNSLFHLINICGSLGTCIRHDEYNA